MAAFSTLDATQDMDDNMVETGRLDSASWQIDIPGWTACAVKHREGRWVLRLGPVVPGS